MNVGLLHGPDDDVAAVRELDIEVVAISEPRTLRDIAWQANAERITPFLQLAWHGVVLTALVHIGYHQIAAWRLL